MAGVSLHMSRDRAEIAALVDVIRDLWCDWDPIGCLSSADWPRDEYDSYLDPPYRFCGVAPRHAK
jgi:hypothetical protein